MTVEISGPEQTDIASCELVLRALPDYFGIEEALLQYLEDMKTRSTFHAHLDGSVVGFLTLTRHNAVSAEIHVMGVLPQEHNQGIGRAMVQAAQRHLQSDGVALLQVKTLGESHPDRNYAKTRQFYLAQGFLPMEEIPDFWGKRVPTLFMVKPLFKRQ